MHYYKHSIADFNNATRHLTRLERSIYRDLIDMYYDTEKPLDADFDKLARRVLVVSDEEKTALKNVLDDFFVLESDGWHQHRCDEELESYISDGEENKLREDNEKERQRRHRDERKRLFAELREKDIVPKWDTPMEQLRELHKQTCNAPATEQKRTCNAPATAITINQEPLTNNHKPRTKNQSHTGSHEILDAEPEDEKSMRDEPAEILNAESKAVGYPTLAGAICVALRANGAAANEVNPANPTLLKLISDGATIDHFVASFSKAKDAGAARPFLYMLTVVASELQAAAKIGNARASPSGLQQNKQEQLEKANALRAQSFIEKMEQQQRGTS